MARPNPNKTISSDSSSGLSKLIADKQSALVKEDSIFIGSTQATVKLKQLILPATQIENKTKIHELNPRIQEELNEDTLKSLLEDIRLNGVNFSVLAVERNGIYYLLDGSRRRYCAKLLGKDLKISVLERDISPTEAECLLQSTTENKDWTYPEKGRFMLGVLEHKGLNIAEMTFEDIADLFNISKSEAWTRLTSIEISEKLRKLYPNHLEISGNYYKKLHKIEAAINKSEMSITHFVEAFEKNNFIDHTKGSAEERQAKVMSALEKNYEAIIGTMKEKKGWSERTFINSENRNVYARSKLNPNKTVLKMEFSRIGKDKIALLEHYVQLICEEKITVKPD